MESFYFSPSKINLFLKVEGKRDDGFHNLFSCFQSLSLGDVLFFKEASEDKLVCEKKEIPINNSNLIIQAINLFRKYTKISTFFHVILHKMIFISAGLGGGSSNAATTLFALNQLTKANLTHEELSLLGSQIGSDVSFFFSKGLALCEGRGDIVTELDSSPLSHLKDFLLIPFQESCSTKLVYEQFIYSDCKNDSLFSREQLLAYLYSNRPIFFNNLESSTLSLFPQIKVIRKDLEKFFPKENIFIAGSGATLVVWIESISSNLLNKIFYKYPTSVLVKAVFRSDKNNWFPLSY